MSFRDFLIENYMSPEQKQKALAAAMDQLKKTYGKGKLDPDYQAAQKRKDEKNRKAREAQDRANKARDAEHKRRMDDDPEYRKAHEKKLKQSDDAWRAYGKARAKKDPSVVSKDGWTGD